MNITTILILLSVLVWVAILIFLVLEYPFRGKKVKSVIEKQFKPTEIQVIIDKDKRKQRDIAIRYKKEKLHPAKMAKIFYCDEIFVIDSLFAAGLISEKKYKERIGVLSRRVIASFELTKDVFRTCDYLGVDYSFQIFTIFQLSSTVIHFFINKNDTSVSLVYCF